MQTSKNQETFVTVTGKKIIDEFETSIETPIINIKGNHECAVIIKMYYSEIEGQLRFFAKVFTESEVMHQIEIFKDKSYKVAF